MIKDILVHLRGTKSDTSVLATALELARLSNAHMECIHIVPNTGLLLPPKLNAEGRSADRAISALEVLEVEAKRRSSAAHDSFSAFCKKNNIAIAECPPGPRSMSAAWCQTNGDQTAQLIAVIRFHDLVVTAGGEEQSAMIYTDLGRLIVDAGKPVLLAPNTLRRNAVRTVAIAWKNAPESARAMTAAMPILCKAQKVIVLCANEGTSNAMECGDSHKRVTNYLQRHGVAAEGHYAVPADNTVPNAILQSAREAGADMLVMGGYGHSRLHELVFGGFTRRILEGTDLPVFIFH